VSTTRAFRLAFLFKLNHCAHRWTRLILCSDRHIDSLSQLTGESADAIRHWFGRLMKQGMSTGQADSAYKSQTALTDQFWNEYSTGLVQVPQLPLEESTQESITTPEIPCARETDTVTQSASKLRGKRKSRCTPTDDTSLLSRDPEKIYQCTRKCGKRYGRKCDWKRNEEEGYPCKSWVCSLCTSEGVDKIKPCFRKYHFAQHFRNIHPGLKCEEYEESSIVCSETEFPRKCGFCKHRFESRQERINHIADHFKQGKSMLDWNDSDDSDVSDNTDNDDDDRPSDDDSDNGRSSYEPPPNDPRGGTAKWYGGGSGGGGYTDGGSSSGAQGGYFQFQLSQLSEGETGRQYYWADQHTKPTSGGQHDQQRTRCASEPLTQRPNEISTAEIYSKQDRFDAPKGDHTNAVARDAFAKTLAKTNQEEIIALESISKLTDDQQPTGVGIQNNKNDWLDVLLESRQRMTVSKTAVSPGSKDDSCHQPTTDRGSHAWDLLKMSLAAPMFASGTKLAETKSTRLDATLGLLKPNVAPAEQRSTLPSAAQPLESKVIISVGSGSFVQLLITKQVLQAISTTSQSFLSVRFLGSGGFSTVDEVVHRGTKLRLGRKTLKNRDPAAIKELWKEVNVLQKLRHPHVIRFLGAYSKGDKMSMLLSPIADTTLALWLDRFSQEKPANFGQVVTKMFGCLASSVRYLHEQRPIVKHMDIKPQNILIVEGNGEFPHVVLCDFGISSSEDLSEGRAQPLTRQYVAPEVFGGFTRKSAADIWSLGCVFAEMASTAFGQGNGTWLSLRKEFSGRTGKYYWQDVSGLQDRLTMVLEEAATIAEQTIVRTLKAMLRSQPTERPDAASLTLIFTPAPCCLSWPNDQATYPGPQEELNSVEMLIHEDGIDCRTQLHQHGEPTARTEQGLPSAKAWLEQCSHTHEACNHRASGHAKTLPTRLVDINPDGTAGNCVRLVDSASLESATDSIAYVALSHAWSQSHATLSTDSLQSMQTNILLSTLSGPLKYAITAAQGLGYRYIWTDSLCVIQDSESNKRDECANMASVFRNAALTLVLDSLDNGLEDFRNALAESKSGFGWDTRAWALQERLLSHRFLHLGQEQLYWECNSLKASETFPCGLPSLVWEKAHTKTKALEDFQQQLPGRQDARIDTFSPLEQENTIEQRRIRDCQWIKRQGDGIGDSMEASQSMLQVGGAQASPTRDAHQHELTDKSANVNDQHNNLVVFTTGTCIDISTRHCDTVATRKPIDIPVSSFIASARQELEASGQMDQNGSMIGIAIIEVEDGDVNANRRREE
jgi:serine/threonine protein kinase